MANYYYDKDGKLKKREEKTKGQKKNDSKKTLFQKGSFDDGYQFGDVTKAILGTTADAGVGILKGAGRLVEGVVDLGGYGVAEVAELFGADKFADNTRKAMQVDTVGEMTKGIDKELNKHSLLGYYGDAVAEGVGQIGTIILTGGAAAGSLGALGATALTSGLMGASSMGSGIGEAYQGGATDGQAWGYGAMKGAVDMASEWIFGGLGKGVKALGLGKGLTSIDDVFARKVSGLVTKHLGNETAQKVLGNTVEYAIKSGAEGLEEVLAGIGTAYAKKFSYMSDKDINELKKDENLLEQFIVGSLTSAIAQGGDMFRTTTKGQDFITGRTSSEQKALDAEVNRLTELYKKNGEKVKKSEIYDEAEFRLKKGYIGTDIIESIIGDKAYSEYKKASDAERAETERLNKEISSLEDKINSSEDISSEDRQKLSSLRSELESLTSNSKVKELKEKLDAFVRDKVKGTSLAESYNEIARQTEKFKADLSKYTAKEQSIVQKAVDSGILNNTNRSHELVDLIAKLSAHLDVDFDFVNNERLKESGFAIDGVSVNGYVTKDGITINTQSPKYLNSVIGHEITHVLKGSELFDSLQKNLFDYAKSRGEYDTRLESLKETYKKFKNVDINEELTADLVGDYIFTDRKFVEHLLNTNRNAFQKIYDELKYLCKIATTGSKEEKALLKAKKIFDDVYSEGETKAVEGVKFSLQGYTKDGRRVYTTDFSDNVSMDERVKLFKDRIATVFNLGGVELKTDVKKIKVKGDTFTSQENIFGDRKGKPWEKEAKINSLYDAADILATSKYLPEKTQTEPSYADKTIPPKNKAHKDVKYWYKFQNEIVFDGVPYTVTFSIRDKGTNQYQYLIDFKENKTLGLSNTVFKKAEDLLRADQASNTIIRNSAEKSTGKFSLSPIAPETSPGGTLKITSDDVTLKAPKVEGEAKTENVLDDDIPIRKEPTLAELRAERDGKFSDTERSYVSMEDFANSESPLWRNVDYNDDDTKSTIMQQTHNSMVEEGKVVTVSDDVRANVTESFPDLRGMKKKERTAILREAMTNLKNNLRQFLGGLKNQTFEFEIDGKVLEAKLYSTGINEVLEKVTENKANMLYTTEQIFKNAQYLYSTTDYDSDPNVYRWNYFYTPVQIGDEIVGVRIAIRDIGRGIGMTPESQIYNWGIKKETSLDGARRGPKVASYDVSSDASSETSLDGVGGGTSNRISNGVSSDVSDNSIPTSSQNVNTPKRPTREELHNNIIERIKARFSKRGFDFDEILRKAKDLSTFATVDNTPQRVMEKSLGYMEGQILADETVNKVAQNETEGIKWLNNYIAEIKKISKEYGIKPNSKASAAAQMYAEGFYVAKNGDIIEYGDNELELDFPDDKVRENIKRLANNPRIRQIYDDTLSQINESRKRNGYPEIPRLDNYFLHFRAMDDTFSRLGLPFNPNDIRAKDLPTDLNGVTADLKPGQPYFASSMHREGKRTSFDLLGGLEGYLSSAKNQIFHIDDIQTLRALRNYIANTYGQAKGLESLDSLPEEEAQEKIKQVYDSHLSTFAKFLNEEANILAGKTSLIDRGIEGIIGRRGIAFLDSVNKQVGSNMVGYNVGSSLTNILPVVQTFAKTNKVAFTKAFAQTVANKFNKLIGQSDGFAENSPVIIRRKGAERFSKTPYQKIADTGYFLMSAVDDISTEIIARTKYNELIKKGMDSQQAHFETDKWVSRLMGDRSLGQQPQIFNSKMLGLFTKFQLEVRNQLDSQFYDTIQEAKASNEHIENALERNAKTAAKVTSTFFQLAVAQHIFGEVFESIVGYNPAFDIISVLATALGFDDDEESEDTALDNLSQGFLELLEDLPYTSVLTGGRVPISSALPLPELVQGVDQYGNEKSRLETLSEAVPYYVLPTGYGQIKKTYQGLSMFDDDLPTSGSYTDSGKLRFPVEDTLGNRVQAGIFGQWSSENAREYFDRKQSPLNDKQLEEFLDSKIPISDYWDYREGLKDKKKAAEKADYINDLDVPLSTKNLLINNQLDRKKSFTMKDYDKYGSFEEADDAQKDPEKYALVSNIFGYDAYQKYQSVLKQIKGEWTKDRKARYIQSLKLSAIQKKILFKSEYPSDHSYDYELIQYIDSLKITKSEKEKIARALGFEVKE